MSTVFFINEGELVVPETWHDQSINVLVDQTIGPGFSLTITRDRIPWGMSFDAYIESEFAKIARTFKGYVEKSRGATSISGANAHAIEFQWASDVGAMHQILVIVANGDKALIFTGTNPSEMNSEQKNNFSTLVKGFRFRGAA